MQKLVLARSILGIYFAANVLIDPVPTIMIAITILKAAILNLPSIFTLLRKKNTKSDRSPIKAQYDKPERHVHKPYRLGYRDRGFIRLSTYNSPFLNYLCVV